MCQWIRWSVTIRPLRLLIAIILINTLRIADWGYHCHGPLPEDFWHWSQRHPGVWYCFALFRVSTHHFPQSILPHRRKPADKISSQWLYSYITVRCHHLGQVRPQGMHVLRRLCHHPRGRHCGDFKQARAAHRWPFYSRGRYPDHDDRCSSLRN